MLHGDRLSVVIIVEDEVVKSAAVFTRAPQGPRMGRAYLPPNVGHWSVWQRLLNER